MDDFENKVGAITITIKQIVDSSLQAGTQGDLLVAALSMSTAE